MMYWKKIIVVAAKEAFFGNNFQRYYIRIIVDCLLLQILQRWPIPKGLIPSSFSTQSIPNFVIHLEISIIWNNHFRSRNEATTKQN